MTPTATAPAMPYETAPMRLSVAPGAQPGTRIISMANQKGGVAKTTSTVNLAAALKERGNRVLVIDLDPQSNLTMSFGIDPEHLEQSMFDVLVHRLPIQTIIHQREVDVAAASIDLVHDREDRLASRRIEQPLLAVWGASSYVGRHFDVTRVWQDYAEDVSGVAAPSDHYVPEEVPDLTVRLLTRFARGEAGA